MKYVGLIGRIFFAGIFIATFFGHFSEAMIGHAASAGIPLPEVAVPLSGFVSLLGGLSVATGYKAKWGAWFLVIFLLPVTLTMHAFWGVSDPMMAQMHQVMFMKNLSMMGAALFIAYRGVGELSLERAQRSRVPVGEAAVEGN